MAILDQFMQNPSTILGLSVLNQADRPAAGLLQGMDLNQRLQGQRSAMETAALNRDLRQQQIMKAQQDQALDQERRDRMRKLTQPAFTPNSVVQGMATGGPVTVPSELQRGIESSGIDPNVAQAINSLASINPQAAVSLMNAMKPAAGTDINIDMREPLKITEMLNIRDKEGKPPPLDATRESVIAATNADGTPKYTVKSSKQQEKEGNVDTALNLVDTLQNLAFPKEGEPLFKKYEGPFGRVAQGLENMWDEMGQTEDRGSRLRLYNHARQGFLSMLARTFGERGTLTNQDIGRALKLTASADYWPDQPETAREAFAELNKLIRDIDGREVDPNAEATVKAIGDTVFILTPDGWETAE